MLLLHKNSPQNLAVYNSHFLMLTQAVGQESGWSSVGTAFLCCTAWGSAERFEGWVLHICQEAGNIWGHLHGSGD